MPFVDIPGERIHYIHFDAKAPVNLVLVHGSGGSHENWPGEISELFCANVYTLDLPGHGKSPGSGRSSVEEYVVMVDAFCQALELSNVALAGHSLGGAIALSSALNKAPWLTRIILVGTGCRLRVMPAIFEIIEKDWGAAVAAIGQTIFGANPDPAVVEQERLRAANVNPQVMLGDFRACDSFDVCRRLGEIELPALILSGDGDKLTPLKYSQFMRDNLKNAQLTVIENAGHLMAVEQPAQFIQALESFLS